MEHRIVMDSSGDLLTLDGVDFASVPLRLVAGDGEFVDDAKLDVDETIAFLRSYKGKAVTACPGAGDYLNAFGDAQNVYCVTITSNLSGSYNAARVAAQTYLEKHPDRHVHVFDSLSTGPEMALIAERIGELIHEGCGFESIVETIGAYQQKTRLMFALESLHNLANNGRVPVTVAAVAGILGIRLIGTASAEGRLEMTGKARGEKKLLLELVKQLRSAGYEGGRMRIHHCCNEQAAAALREQLMQLFPQAAIRIFRTRGLCSFYAERGGMLIGFETA